MNFVPALLSLQLVLGAKKQKSVGLRAGTPPALDHRQHVDIRDTVIVLSLQVCVFKRNVLSAVVTVSELLDLSVQGRPGQYRLSHVG